VAPVDEKFVVPRREEGEGEVHVRVILDPAILGMRNRILERKAKYRYELPKLDESLDFHIVLGYSVIYRPRTAGARYFLTV